MFKKRKKKYRYEKFKLNNIKGFSSKDKNAILNFLVRTRSLSEKFTTHDVAQQIIGSIILAMPFITAQEIWNLARLLDGFRIVSIILLTIFVDFSILKFTMRGSIEVPWKRMISLVVVSYTFSFLILSTIGVIGNIITDPIWAGKLVVFISLFSSIGAATADVLIFK